MQLPAVVTKGLDSHDGTANAPRLAQNYPKKVENALLGALTQFAKQFPVILEEPPQDFRHAEYILPMGNMVQNICLQVRPEPDYFFWHDKMDKTSDHDS